MAGVLKLLCTSSINFIIRGGIIFCVWLFPDFSISASSYLPLLSFLPPPWRLTGFTVEQRWLKRVETQQHIMFEIVSLWFWFKGLQWKRGNLISITSHLKWLMFLFFGFGFTVVESEVMNLRLFVVSKKQPALLPEVKKLRSGCYEELSAGELQNAFNATEFLKDLRRSDCHRLWPVLSGADVN